MKKNYKNLNFETENYINWLFLIFGGLFAPWILLPLVNFFGISEIWEEIIKVIFIIFVIWKFKKIKTQILAGLILGATFGLSESILYLNNFWQLGDLSLFLKRLIYTCPLHVLTVMIMTVISYKKRWLIILGFILAVLTHYIFNFLI